MTTQVAELVRSNQGQALLTQMYGAEQVQEQAARYEKLAASFQEHSGAQADVKLFSSPGRSEIGGNHTALTMISATKSTLNSRFPRRNPDRARFGLSKSLSACFSSRVLNVATPLHTRCTQNS